MPIKPENKKLYPNNWKEIRNDILTRANNCCEFCKVPNKSFLIYRNNKIDDIVNPDDKFYNDALKQYSTRNKWSCCEDGKIIKYRIALVVLTIAHLDQNPTHNDYSNLKALCQKCHNTLDAPFRIQHRRNL